MESDFHDLTLLRRCGAGAFGEVWLCRDVSGRILAVKRIPREMCASELRGIAALHRTIPEHPNVLRILHVAEDEDYLWYTMDPADNLASSLEEYLPDTLENRLRDHLAVDLFAVADDLLAALRHLHASGVVHRDVKPGNILFVHGRAVLGDVGMAAACTSTLSLAGTIGFLPPELRGTVHPSSASGKNGDVYAAGMVLYCMMTGNSAEQFPSLPSGLPLSARTRRLNHLICRICAKKSSERLTDPAKIAAELLRIRRLGETPVGIAEHLCFHWRRIAAVCIVLVFLGVAAAGVGGLLHYHREREAALELLTADYPGRNGTRTYRYKPGGFTIDVPCEWAQLTRESLRDLSSAVKAAKDHFGERRMQPGASELFGKLIDSGMAVFVCNVDDPCSDLVHLRALQGDFEEYRVMREDQFRIFVLENIREMFSPDAQVYSVRRYTMHGHTVIEMETSVVPEEMRQKIVLIFAGRRIAEIALHAAKERYVQYLPAFDAMVKTVRF